MKTVRIIGNSAYIGSVGVFFCVFFILKVQSAYYVCICVRTSRQLSNLLGNSVYGSFCLLNNCLLALVPINHNSQVYCATLPAQTAHSYIMLKHMREDNATKIHTSHQPPDPYSIAKKNKCFCINQTCKYKYFRVLCFCISFLDQELDV